MGLRPLTSGGEKADTRAVERGVQVEKWGNNIHGGGRGEFLREKEKNWDWTRAHAN